METKKLDTNECAKVKETDLKNVESVVRGLRKQSTEVLESYETLYNQLINGPTEAKEDMCKREVGKNRVDEIRLELIDIGAILEEIYKFRLKFEDVIG